MKFFACQKLMEIKTKIHLSLAINVIPFQIFVSKRSSLTYLKKIFTIYTYFGQARNQNKKLPSKETKYTWQQPVGKVPTHIPSKTTDFQVHLVAKKLIKISASWPLPKGPGGDEDGDPNSGRSIWSTQPTSLVSGISNLDCCRITFAIPVQQQAFRPSLLGQDKKIPQAGMEVITATKRKPSKAVEWKFFMLRRMLVSHWQ